MTDNKYKSLIAEIGLQDEEAEYEAILEELSQNPADFGYVEPPAGYENHLIQALREQLPVATAPAAAVEQSNSASWVAGLFAGIIGSRGLAWGLSGGMAVLVGVMSFQMTSQAPDEGLQTQDFLMQTAQSGDSQAVERWVASVADLGVQLNTDTDSLAEDLAENPKKAAQALDDVARSLGYTGEI